MQQAPLTLICLAHTNWDHVWQRPQHLMSRFASRCRVVYIDPPQTVGAHEKAHLQERPGDNGVRVLRPILPARQGDTNIQVLSQFMASVLAECGPNIILWIYSPIATMFAALAKSQTKLTVYDCMDDYASFQTGFAPSEMRSQERLLLSLVDLVFTGGHSMYEARKQRHPRVYCFPSGVEITHYQQVYDPMIEVPPEMADLAHPRLGYFGVLDERIDWALIQAVAEQRPTWQWVLIGPEDPTIPGQLPRAANIHYLGQQPYPKLPAYLKGFDIATMPFVLSEATRSTSPTKTLEYLAGGKPVISTSVPDVVAFYNEIVYIADGVHAWLESVDEIASATPAQLQSRLDRAQPILEQSSWDSIAARMWELMQEQLA